MIITTNMYSDNNYKSMYFRDGISYANKYIFAKI